MDKILLSYYSKQRSVMFQKIDNKIKYMESAILCGDIVNFGRFHHDILDMYGLMYELGLFSADELDEYGQTLAELKAHLLSVYYQELCK